MPTAAHILIADDDATVLTALRMLLETQGYQVTQVSQPKEVEFYVTSTPFDLLIMDLNYQLDTTSGQEGLQLIDNLRRINDDLPIVVMTGWASIDIAVTAMQKGANDFIQKPWDNQRLLSTLTTHLQLADSKQQAQRLGQENQLLKAQLSGGLTQPFVAESPAMQRLMQQVQALAHSDASVLITGENGCGKSLLAQHIHQLSGRAEQPFIAVNMGSIPETLFESEMFGHVKGAFTDARAQRIGRVELADGGTLFMDEVGNTPVSQQAKLLRVLEEQAFEKVGASITQRADIRVIAATNADLHSLVEQQQFRMDLLFRLNTMTLRIPPLRERLEDIPLLANQFVSQFCEKYRKPDIRLSEHALQALCAYPWPGNIRELSHVMERAVIFNRQEEILASQLMLDDGIVPSSAVDQTDTSDASDTEFPTLEAIEKEVIVQRLAQFNGNANATAASLGMSRSAFYRRLDKYKL